MSKLLALLALSVLLVGCSPEPHQQAVAHVVVPAAIVVAPQPITFAVAGDSVTAGFTNITFPHPGPTFDTNSWVHWALEDGLVLTGGYAYPGKNSTEILAGFIPVDSDVLVIMVGTNNLNQAPSDGAVYILRLLSDVIQMPARTGDDAAVVLSAIPPSNTKPGLDDSYNAALHDLALQQGWTWVDPWVGCRSAGAWVVGYTDDGMHPNPVGAELGAGLIVEAVRSAHDV